MVDPDRVLQGSPGDLLATVCAQVIYIASQLMRWCILWALIVVSELVELCHGGCFLPIGINSEPR